MSNRDELARLSALNYRRWQLALVVFIKAELMETWLIETTANGLDGTHSSASAGQRGIGDFITATVSQVVTRDPSGAGDEGSAAFHSVQVRNS